MLLPGAKKFKKRPKKIIFVEVLRCRYLDCRNIEPSPMSILKLLLEFQRVTTSGAVPSVLRVYSI